MFNSSEVISRKGEGFFSIKKKTADLVTVKSDESGNNCSAKTLQGNYRLRKARNCEAETNLLEGHGRQR